MPRRNKDLELLEEWKSKGVDLAREFGILDPKKRFRRKLRSEIQAFVKLIPDKEKLIDRMNEEMNNFLSRDRFWEQSEMDAFKTTMRKKSSHAYFCTEVQTISNGAKSVKVPDKADLLLAFFNRGDTVKRVGLELWYAVPEELHIDEYVVEPGRIVFLWNGSFPLMQHMCAHATPTVHILDGTTWDDLYLVQGYLDFHGRWEFYNHIPAFQSPDGFRIHFFHGLAFRVPVDEPLIRVPHVPTIEYPPFEWKDRDVLVGISLHWNVSEDDTSVQITWNIENQPR